MQYMFMRFVAPTALLLLSACATTIGAPGPAGPPGPPGPAGALELPLRLSVVTSGANVEVGPTTDVVIATARVTVVLPPVASAGSGRTVTVRNRLPEPAPGAAAAASQVTIRPAITRERIEGERSLVLDRDEMVTLVSDGVESWTVISASDL